MYSSCPECGTVFRITTNELRAAEGYVRCGHCSATFNAVTTLSDEPPPTVTVQHLSLPSEAASPQPPAVLDDSPAPEISLAEEEVSPVDDAPATGGETLEFDIPEDSWTNFFEAPPVAPPPPLDPPADLAVETVTDSAPEPVDEAIADEVGTGIGSDTVDQAGLYRALAAESAAFDPDGADWEALLQEVEDDDADPEPVYVLGEESGPPPAVAMDTPKPDLEPEPAPESEPEPEVAPDDYPGHPAWDDAVLDDTQAPKPLPADFAADLPDGRAGAELRIADRPFVWEPPPPPRAEPRRHWGYAAGSGLLALLIVMQLLHLQRDELATNPSLFAPLQRLYGALGVPLWPAWDLRSYQVRGSEAVTDRSSRGALDILARIDVIGDERVGLPLVRVTLLDRFGKPLSSRVFEPAEYLGKTPRPREPVPPGTQIPVEINLKDPGIAALGFDVDVCVMNRRDGLLCRTEREPFAP
ncbi:MAG: DUF3426 domain-containing protein, partial [Gammaproteobacteria bacterium]